jgi:tetratricopeptide (TPR) repeat protein
LCCVVVADVVPIATASAVEVGAAFTSRALPSGLEFTLSWPEPTGVEVEKDARELLLRFNRPLGDAPVADLAVQYADLIENVRYGYDSILIRATRDVRFDVTPTERGVLVQLVPPAEPKPQPQPDSADVQQDEFRLSYLRALALLQERKVSDAQQLLQQLHDQDPENLDVLASLAYTEVQLGRWQKAKKLYDEGLKIRPDEQRLIAGRQELQRQHGTSAETRNTYINYHNSDWEVFTRQAGRYRLNDQWMVLGAVETVYVDAQDIRRVSGGESDFSGARVRGELGVDYDWQDSGVTRGTFFINPDSQGGALSHAFGPLLARTSARVAYHEAEWRYLQGVVNQGTRDQIAVKHSREIIPTLNGGLGVALNRYGVRNDDNVARSVQLDGFLRYTFRPAAPLLNLSYYLDAEYSHRDRERNAAGERFTPLDVESREVHTLEVSAGGEIAKDLTYIAGVGGIADRINDSFGPLGVLGVQYLIVSNVALDVYVRHALASSRGESGQYTEAGLALVWYAP